MTEKIRSREGRVEEENRRTKSVRRGNEEEEVGKKGKQQVWREKKREAGGK